MVVSVVVRDCWDWFGEEKVLFLPAPSIELKAPPAVVVVRAREYPASECTVSGFVVTVGAADLLPASGASTPALFGMDDEKLPRCACEGGVEKERWSSGLSTSDRAGTFPDSGYGLFFDAAAAFFDLAAFDPPVFFVFGESEDLPVRRLTQAVNGLLRECRSEGLVARSALAIATVAGDGLGYGAGRGRLSGPEGSCTGVRPSTGCGNVLEI